VKCISLLIGCCLVCSSVCSKSQELVDDDLFVQESAAARDGDEFEKIRINLNNNLKESIEARTILHEYEIEQIEQHKAQYGDLAHIHELQVFMDTQRIFQILPYLNNLSFSIQGVATHRLEAQVSNNTRSRINCINGKNHNPQMRLRYKRVFGSGSSLAMAFEGDQAESWTGQKMFFKPDLVKFYYAWKSQSWNIVAGHMRYSLGEGMFSSQSSLSGGIGSILGLKNSKLNIQGDQSFYEFAPMGIGVLYSKNRTSAVVVASTRKLDATISNDSAFSSLNFSGIHRTTSEITTRKNLRELASIIHVRHAFGKLDVGVSSKYTAYDKDYSSRSRLDNIGAISGRIFHEIGSDYCLRLQNSLLFGEIKFLLNSEPNFLLGLITAIGSKLDWSLLLTSYNARHLWWNSNALGQWSRNKNENGISTGIKLSLSRRNFIQFAVNHRSPKYFSYGNELELPQSTNWKATLVIDKRDQFRLTMRLRQTIANYSRRDFINSQLLLRTELLLRKNIRWRVQAITNASESGLSFLVYSDWKIRANRLEFYLRNYFSFSNNPENSNYFYTLENDLLRSFSGIQLGSHGYRNYGMIVYKPKRSVQLRLKIWNQGQNIYGFANSTQPEFGVKLQSIFSW